MTNAELESGSLTSRELLKNKLRELCILLNVVMECMMTQDPKAEKLKEMTRFLKALTGCIKVKCALMEQLLNASERCETGGAANAP